MPRSATASNSAARKALRIAVVAVLLLVPMAEATCAEIHVASHSNDDGAVVVEGTARLDADIATAWQVLTDYSAYSRFVPGLRSSTVRSRAGPTVIVEQVADVAFGIFRERVDVTYEIGEHAPGMLASRIIAGCDCSLESSYTLTPSDAGVLLSFRSTLVTGDGIRAAFQRSAGVRSIKDHFHALANEMERRSATRASMPTDASPR